MSTLDWIVLGLLVGFILVMTRLALNIFSGSIAETSMIYKIFLVHNWLHYETSMIKKIYVRTKWFHMFSNF